MVQDEDLAARAEPSVGVWARQMSIAGCARPDTWADMVTVSGLARALHSLVVVFIGGHRPSVFTPSGEVGYRRVLALAHDGRTAGHFTPVNIPEKLTQFLLMHEPTPRLPPLTCVSREGLLDCPLEDSRADFGNASCARLRSSVVNVIGSVGSAQFGCVCRVVPSPQPARGPCQCPASHARRGSLRARTR